MRFTTTRVRNPFVAGSEPNGRVNQIATENGEAENPKAESRGTDGSPRSRAKGFGNRESALALTVANLCDIAQTKTPTANANGASVHHSAQRIP
jgi:hypothetical protein